VKFRNAFRGLRRGRSANRRGLRQRNISGNCQSRPVIVRQIDRPIVVFASVAIDRFIFMGMIAVMRMNCTG